MKFFLDSANIEEVLVLADRGLIRGVTTNPILVAEIANGRSMKEVLAEMRHNYDGILNAEPTATDYETLREQIATILSWDNTLVVKIPGTPDGLHLARELSAQGIQTNVTLITSISQAIMAAEAGALYVSPYVGRMEDHGKNGIQFIKDLRAAFDNGGYTTAILAASIRTREMMDAVAVAGADIVTAPYAIYQEVFNEKVLLEGIAKFEDAAKKFTFE